MFLIGLSRYRNFTKILITYNDSGLRLLRVALAVAVVVDARKPVVRRGARGPAPRVHHHTSGKRSRAAEGALAGARTAGRGVFAGLARAQPVGATILACVSVGAQQVIAN